MWEGLGEASGERGLGHTHPFSRILVAPIDVSFLLSQFGSQVPTVAANTIYLSYISPSIIVAITLATPGVGGAGESLSAAAPQVSWKI